MCRFAAYVGPPRPLSALLYEGTRSLSTQAWDPHEMLYGNVNVDGTGVVWWAPDEEGHGDPTLPLRYVTPAAAWNDANLPHLAGRISARTMLAAVRSATPGIPFGPANVAPFTNGELALAHNGFVQGFRQGVGRKLLARVSDRVFDAMDTVSDSLTLLLLVRDHVDNGMALPEAVEATLAIVHDVLEDTDRGATLNLLVSDGDVVVACRAAVRLEQNSLYTSSDALSGGITIASEPLDPDAMWEKVEPQTLVVVDQGIVRTRPIP